MITNKLLSVVSTFFESKLALSEKVDFELIKINKENSYFVGSGVFDDPEDPLTLVFTIPLNHKHFYFTITEADSKVYQRELALLQHYSECVSDLCIDHSIPSNGDELTKQGYAGFVLVTPSVFHSSLNETIVFEDNSITGIGVLPATQEDLDLKRRNGTDALYELWDSKGKDCVAF